MRRGLIAAVLSACALLLMPAVAHAAEVLPASLSTAPAVVQVAGPTRIETAIEASKRAFPGHANTVVLATGYNWPDALGGSALAGAKAGPLLLTLPGSLPSAVTTELARLDAHEVIILGKTPAVSAAVETTLRRLSVNGHALTVSRIGGDERFATSAMVASATVAAIRAKGGTYSGTAFFTTGWNFPDALAASPLAAKKGWPVLLVGPSGLSTVTADAVRSLGVTRGIMLGSDKVVTAAVEHELKSMLPKAPERLWGSDRYLTGIAIASFATTNGLGWDGVAITTGENYPDALAGGVMQARLGSVVLLTPTAWLQKCVFDQLAAVRAKIYTVRYLGSTVAVRQFARDGVTAALTGHAYLAPNWMTFPVAGPCNYSDDFGAPRTGHTHQGNDIFAARNTPCVAVLNGTATVCEWSGGGHSIDLHADNGWTFWYMHLDHWPTGWVVGKSYHVNQGQVVGYVGDTGNASGGAYHLHFEVHKPDGTVVDPYPYLQGMLR